jgi:hypothetical protein
MDDHPSLRLRLRVPGPSTCIKDPSFDSHISDSLYRTAYASQKKNRIEDSINDCTSCGKISNVPKQAL